MTREEAIKVIRKMLACTDLSVRANLTADMVDACHMAIKALEQEPKMGHWEYGYAFADGNYCKCSECKEIIKCIYPMHYCPSCGADMREVEK